MSKTAKPKNRQPSVHSRAARRATSPSLNTDKSLKNVTPPQSNPHTYMFKAKDAGIKKRKNKQPKRGQLERQRKGVERADAVKEQLDSKLQKSLGKLKTIRDRRKDWDVLNLEIGIPGEVSKPSKFAALEDTSGDEEVEMEETKPPAEDVINEGVTVRLPDRSIQIESAFTEKENEDDDVVE